MMFALKERLPLRQKQEDGLSPSVKSIPNNQRGTLPFDRNAGVTGNFLKGYTPKGSSLSSVGLGQENGSGYRLDNSPSLGM